MTSNQGDILIELLVKVEHRLAAIEDLLRGSAGYPMPVPRDPRVPRAVGTAARRLYER